MAVNWTVYEAAKEIYGTNKENIAEIGSRFPLFTRTVSMANNDYVLDILKALPKVTARMVETGLKDMEVEDETDVTVEETKEDKAETKKPAKKAKKKEEPDESGSYDTMTSKDLYALCCERGISSLCKSRKKESLIELLEKYDAGEIEKTNGRKKAEKVEPKKAEKSSKKAESEDDWDNWDDEEDESNPYEGKTAKELFKMCTDRGIKTKPRQSADAYVKLLQKADEAEADTESEDDEDEDWEI